MEYTFEVEEMKVFGIDVIVSGTIEFDIEDTAVGYVPYGDTYVWHRGDGDVAVEQKAHRAYRALHQG